MSAPAPPTLRNPDLDRSLRDRGFAVIPFLTPTEVELLRDAYWADAPDAAAGMVVDYMVRDRTAMHRTRDLVEPLFDTHAPTHLDNQQLALATFAVKHPGGNESAFFLHDDRSYVDERRARTATVWIPLVDVGPDIDNGGLQVVPRSHLLPTGLSGSLTPDLIRPYESYLREQLVTVPVPAGHALVYDTRVLHASSENHSGRPREALALAVAPRDEPLLHVVATGRRHRRVHSIDERFFLDHHVREIEVSIGVEYPVVAEYDDDCTLTPQEVASALGTPLPVRQVALPGDLFDEVAVADLTALPSHPVGSADPTKLRDLTIDATDLGSAGEPIAAMRSTQGQLGRSAVRRAWRNRSTATTRSITDRAPVPRTAADADALVLDPGGRVEITLPAGRCWSYHLTVAECPAVGAGLRSGHRAMNLEPGRRVELVVDRPLRIWNEGPGPLAAVLSRSPSAVTATMSALRRLAGGRASVRS